MKTLIFVVALFAIFSTSKALAVDLKINVDQVRVYSQPNPGSSVMTTLHRNDTIKASNKPLPGYQKVLVNGKDVGYIRNADLLPRPATAARPAAPAPQQNLSRPAMAAARPATQARKPAPRRVGRGIGGRMGVSVIAGMNYQNQGSRNYVAADGSAASISSLSGTSLPLLGIQFQYPIHPKISLRAYVEFIKNISVSGSATYQTSSLATGAPTDTFLKESFLSVGILGAYYFSPYFWGGAGLQMDKANSGTLKFGSYPETALSGSDLPTFFAAFGAVGYDFEVSKSIYLTPELRIGALFSKPLIIEVDGLVNATYAF